MVTTVCHLTFKELFITCLCVSLVPMFVGILKGEGFLVLLNIKLNPLSLLLNM